MYPTPGLVTVLFLELTIGTIAVTEIAQGQESVFDIFNLFILFELFPYTSRIQILPHEVYLSFLIDVIHNALCSPVFFAQETIRAFRPGPFLFVAEFDQLFAHCTNIPVFEDTPILGGGIRYNDRFFLIG